MIYVVMYLGAIRGQGLGVFVQRGKSIALIQTWDALNHGLPKCVQRTNGSDGRQEKLYLLAIACGEGRDRDSRCYP